MDNAARLPFRRGFTAAGAPGATQTIGSSIQIASPIGATQTSMLPATLGLVGQANQFRGDLARIGPRFDTADGTPDIPNLAATTLALLGSGRRLILRAVQAQADFQVGGPSTPASPVYYGRSITNGDSYVTASTSFSPYYGLVDGSGLAIGNSPAGSVSSTVAGQVGKPIDAAYIPGTWISKYDWYYVVEEGPALVTLAGSVTVGNEVQWDTTTPGKALAYTQAATTQCVGTLIAVAGGGSSASSGNALIWVHPGLRIG